ncbi:CerR family C-terminal domain-containing protein [Polaromonas eurypsychrophila]|uniref:TetR family transcriptional regulator n=1 Tax=Polaromonas eurypsychrophila TaxID=1614635 RepID=A0A916S868_9BURK|nr:CerR family C-terminal domain-containing protein [Polaromonas eurypsychrophila]GGA88039.1 TetR family transcriptional regulator [Polaromonas eurypsychrophila]
MKTALLAASPAGNRSQDTRKQRSDGAEARAHLLLTALRLFAEKGFSKTSTRDIAQAAGANVAAISYYFGDKAGLYRSVFTEPLGVPCDDISRYQPAHLSLREALEGFIAGFLEPLKQGDMAQQITRLHFREMLEPTGLWAEQINNNIKPAHVALTEVLGRHLRVTKIDDDVHRLAFSIAALAMQMFISRDVIENVRPQLIATPKAIDLWAIRLADFAEAMIAVEAARRRLPVDKKKTS